MKCFIVVLAVLASACAQSGTGAVGALPETNPDSFAALVATSDRPVVLNIWGSWCIPCRSEAPLLRAAHRRFGDEVRFVGIAVRDRQRAAQEFISEFGLGGFDHFFDSRNSVSADLGGRGVPLTFFFTTGGELLRPHRGIIDERTLAIEIDELLRSPN